jgi:hypothetical protein
MKPPTISPNLPEDVTFGDEFLTEKQLSKRHGRSIKTLQADRSRQRGIPFVRLGRSIRYRLADILQFEQTNTHEFPAAQFRDGTRGRRVNHSSGSGVRTKGCGDSTS